MVLFLHAPKRATAPPARPRPQGRWEGRRVARAGDGVACRMCLGQGLLHTVEEARQSERLRKGKTARARVHMLFYLPSPPPAQHTFYFPRKQSIIRNILRSTQFEFHLIYVTSPFYYLSQCLCRCCPPSPTPTPGGRRQAKHPLVAKRKTSSLPSGDANASSG